MANSVEKFVDQQVNLNNGAIPAKLLKKKKVAEVLERRAAAELPPPGDYRREVLKLRGAKLDAEVNRLADLIQAGVATGDSLAERFGLENDVVRHFDRTGAITFRNARADKVYAWLPHLLPRDNPGAMIEQQLMVPGWEVVKGYQCTKECKSGAIATCEHSFPEARELIDEQGRRKVGDVILMRCDLMRHMLNIAEERAQRRLRRKDANRPITDIHGRRVHSSKKDAILSQFFARVGGGDGMKETLIQAPASANAGADSD